MTAVHLQLALCCFLCRTSRVRVLPLCLLVCQREFQFSACCELRDVSATVPLSFSAVHTPRQGWAPQGVQQLCWLCPPDARAQLTPPPSCQENVSWRQNPLCLDSLFQSDFKKIFFSYLLTYLSFPVCFILLYKFRFPSGAVSFCLKDFFLHFCSASLLVANAFIHALGNVFISP